MGFLDKLFGRDEAAQPLGSRHSHPASALSEDEQAIARYRYMLKTAPPETVELAHAEAFAKLTREQRMLLLQELSADIPQAERPAAGASGQHDPRSLARLATRAEVRQPGTMERVFGGMGGRGAGMGGMMAGGFLSTMAGVVVGSAIAQSFLGDSNPSNAVDGEPSSDELASDTSADADAESDAGDFGDGDIGEI